MKPKGKQTKDQKGVEKASSNIQRLQKSNSLFQDDLKDLYSDLVQQMVGTAAVSQQQEKGVQERSAEDVILGVQHQQATSLQQQKQQNNEFFLEESNQLANSEQKIQELQLQIILLCKEKGELQSKNNEFETTFEDLNSRLKQSLNKNDELERTIFTLQKDIENHEKLERKHREQIDIFEEKIMGIPKIISNIIMQFIDLFQNLGDIMVQEITSQEKVELFANEIEKLKLNNGIEDESLDHNEKQLKGCLNQILKDVGGRFQVIRSQYDEQINLLEAKVNEFQSEIYGLKDLNVKQSYHLKKYQKKDQENMVIAQQNRTMLQMVSQLDCYKKFKSTFEELGSQETQAKSPVRLSQQQNFNQYQH